MLKDSEKKTLNFYKEQKIGYICGIKQVKKKLKNMLMKQYFHILLIAITTLICSCISGCTKVDNTIPNLESLITLKARNIKVYKIYSKIAEQDSAMNEWYVINQIIASEKSQLDSCKRLYLRLRKKIPTHLKLKDSTIISTNTADNIYKILVDKQLEGYNLLPAMITNIKGAKSEKFAPFLARVIEINQLNSNELHRLLNSNSPADSTHKINIITNI